MEEEVSVRIGADTSGVDAGAKEVVKDVAKVDASIEDLRKSIDDLSSSIKKTFGSMPKSPIEDEAKKGKKAVKDEAEAISDLTRRIQAETAALGLGRVEREATLRTMQQQEALARSGIKVSQDQVASLMRLNTEWAKARTGGSKTGGGIFGLDPHEIQNVTFQLNDLFVQIASGQGVIRPLVQQIPQIAQQGGAKILAGLLPLLPVIALVAAGLGALALGLKKLGDEGETLRSLNGQLAINANGARYQAEALARNVAALDEYGASLKQARDEVTLFVTKGLDPSRIVAFGKASQDLADVMKLDVTAAASQVVTAFTGGYEAVVKLDEAYNFLTEAQRNEIRTAFESGDAKRGQDAAFAAFQARVREGAEYARGPGAESARTFAAAWDDVMEALAHSEAIEGAHDAVVDLTNAVAGAITKFGELKKAQENAQKAGVTPAMPSASAFTPLGLLNAATNFGASLAGGKTAKTPQASLADMRGMFGPKPAADPQVKAANDLVASLQAQRNETLKINDAQRVTLAGNQAVLKATNDQKIVRADLLAQIRKEAEETKRAEIAKETAAKDKSATSAAKTAANAATRAAREALQDQIAAIETQKAEANLAYADQMALEDQKLAKLRAFYSEDSKEYQAALREKTRMQAAETVKQDAYLRQSIATARQVAMLKGDVEIAAQRSSLASQRDELESQRAAGLIRTTTYYERLAELDRQSSQVTAQEIENRYRIQLGALEAEMTIAIAGTDEYRRLEEEKTRITAEQAAARAKAIIAASDSAEAIVRQGFDASRQKAQSIIQPIAGSFTGLFAGLATGTQSFAQGWANVGQAILSTITQAVTEMITTWALGQLGMTTATVAGATTRVGVEATAAATTTGISASAALVQIAHKAAVAAAGAYSAIAGIPYIGPFLAPIAAGVALAGVLALGKTVFSAAGGWGEVPEDGMTTTLHKKEMVLPASIATPLRAAIANNGPDALASGRGKSGGDTYNFPISAVDARSVQRLFMDNQDTLVDLLRDALRKGKAS